MFFQEKEKGEVRKLGAYSHHVPAWQVTGAGVEGGGSAATELELVEPEVSHQDPMAHSA